MKSLITVFFTLFLIGCGADNAPEPVEKRSPPKAEIIDQLDMYRFEIVGESGNFVASSFWIDYNEPTESMNYWTVTLTSSSANTVYWGSSAIWTVVKREGGPVTVRIIKNETEVIDELYIPENDIQHVLRADI